MLLTVGDAPKARSKLASPLVGNRADAHKTALLNASGGPKRAANQGPFPLLLFSQQLLTLLQAGLTLPEALEALAVKDSGSTASEMLRALLEGLQEGLSFSATLEAQGATFPPVYIALVRASESTGELPGALARMIEHLKQGEALRKAVGAAMIYPVLLVVVGALVTLFLIGYVVPRFASVYEGSATSLPQLTRAFLWIGQAIQGHSWLIASVLSFITIAAVWWLRRLGTAAVVERAVQSLPFVRQRSHEFALARFYRTTGLLLESGIPLMRALDMAKSLLAPPQATRLVGAMQAVEEGRSLSEALVAADLAGSVALSLIRVGERTGQQAQMLQRAASFGEDELTQWMAKATRLLEPVMMVLIGLVVGVIVVSMYMPIFDLAERIQ